MFQRKLYVAVLSLLALIVGIGVLRATTACADFYKYTDDTGAVSITNDRNAVPPKYRATMTVEKDAALEKKDPGARKQPSRDKLLPPARGGVAPSVESAPSPAPPPATNASSDSLTGRFPWLRPLAIVAGITVLFLLVAKVASQLSSPQLSRVIYLAFFLGVFVFGYKLYADSLLESYKTIKTRVLTMFAKANERQAPETGEKAPQGSFSDQAGKTE